MDIGDLLTILQGFLYAINLIVAVVYALSIICIPRFHNQHNIFVLNMCINIILTWLFFIIYFLIADYEYPRQICNLLYYSFNVASIEVPFAFVAFSVHRLCLLKYHTRAFVKRKLWVATCIIGQWISQFVISLPFFFRSKRVSRDGFVIGL